MVSNALVRLPGVTVAESFCSGGITHKEFRFHIWTSGGHTVDLLISDSDPVCKMSGMALLVALADKIRKEFPKDSQQALQVPTIRSSELPPASAAGSRSP